MSGNTTKRDILAAHLSAWLTFTHAARKNVSERTVRHRLGALEFRKRVDSLKAEAIGSIEVMAADNIAAAASKLVNWLVR